MTKEEKRYLNELADLEYQKYLRTMEMAKYCADVNDKDGLAHWLNVSAMALHQSAEYRRKGS